LPEYRGFSLDGIKIFEKVLKFEIYNTDLRILKLLGQYLRASPAGEAGIV